jgi:MOSC domain-containing protein YiiM
MNTEDSSASLGQVASLHLHPVEPGDRLESIDMVELVEGKGIAGDRRYFGKISQTTGKLSRRQVSLVEREVLAQHAGALGLTSIPAGAVRSNIETTGVELVPLVGQEIEIGEAVLFVYAPRDPCAKMDAICQGLRQRMTNAKQGVMAEVRRGGKVRVGDPIRVRSAQSPAHDVPANE